MKTILNLENPVKLLKENTKNENFTVASVNNELSSLIKIALKQRPELIINNDKQINSITELELAKANRIPNLSVTLGPDLVINNSANDSIGLFVIGNVSLPVLYQGAGEIQAAKARHNQLMREKEDLNNQINLEVSNAYYTLNSSNARLKRFENELNPKNEIINQKSLRCFEEGKCSIFIPVSAKQSLIETRVNYLNALADYQNSISDLEKAIGGSYEI